MTDTPKPGDIHGHPIVECTDDLHKTLAGHQHDDPSSDSGAEVWEDCWCPIQFVRPEPTPEPWAGHPIKWCEEHAGLAEPDEAECPRADLSGFDYRFEAPCQFTAYQPWADLLAERDEARKDRDESAHLICKLGDILTAVTNALNGPPPPLTTWGWGYHDLPDRAKRLVAERDEARKELVALRVLDGAPAGRAETERDEAREEQR